MFDLHLAAGIADIGAEARRCAAGGAAGTFVWAPDAARFHACLVLAPREPLKTAALSLYLGMLALGDAVGSLIPPGIDLTFRWPNQCNLNAARFGAVLLEPPAGVAADEVPAWLLLSFELAISAAGRDLEMNATTLADEGCHGIESADLLESLARHALSWSNRWQEDGFPPVRSAWASRVAAEIELVPVRTAAGIREGRFVDLDQAGDLLINIDGAQRTIALLDALRGEA